MKLSLFRVSRFYTEVTSGLITLRAVWFCGVHCHTFVFYVSRINIEMRFILKQGSEPLEGVV